MLRDGALAIDGLERLVHQPDEHPTEPMAMPAGASHDVLEIRGGYLPSLANAIAYNASGGIASDSPSLARWWRAFCAGEIVSQASLTEMSTFEPAAHLGTLRARRCTTLPTGTPQLSGTPDSCPATCRGPRACPRTKR